MKKCVILLVILSLSIIFPFLSLYADMGPKRTLDVEIVGVEKPYYIELLMKASLPSSERMSEIRQYINEQHDQYPEMLFTFDFDGYVSSTLVLPWGTWYQSPKDYYHIFSYNPPQAFKIMLVFDDGNYVISRHIETKLFNSKVVFDLSGINLDMTQTHVGKVKEIFPLQTMTVELLLRIIGTIFIEILVLFLFGYMTKKSYQLIAFVNLGTQVALTGLLFGAKYFVFPVIGELFVLLIFEAIIFITEIVLYRIYLKEKSKRRATLYALVANTITLIASFSVMILMMNM